jgi:hypothetical protein
MGRKKRQSGPLYKQDKELAQQKRTTKTTRSKLREMRVRDQEKE